MGPSPLSRPSSVLFRACDGSSRLRLTSAFHAAASSVSTGPMTPRVISQAGHHAVESSGAGSRGARSASGNLVAGPVCAPRRLRSLRGGDCWRRFPAPRAGRDADQHDDSADVPNPRSTWPPGTDTDTRWQQGDVRHKGAREVLVWGPGPPRSRRTSQRRPERRTV